MYRIKMEPSGLEWHYCLPGTCTDPGCPGGCIHIDTEIHHLTSEDTIKLVKATKLIAEVCSDSGQTKFKEELE